MRPCSPFAVAARRGPAAARPSPRSRSRVEKIAPEASPSCSGRRRQYRPVSTAPTTSSSTTQSSPAGDFGASRRSQWTTSPRADRALRRRHPALRRPSARGQSDADQLNSDALLDPRHETRRQRPQRIPAPASRSGSPSAARRSAPRDGVTLNLTGTRRTSSMSPMPYRRDDRRFQRGLCSTAGWLCRGRQPLSVSDEPALFEAIGNRYGGDGVKDSRCPTKGLRRSNERRPGSWRRSSARSPRRAELAAYRAMLADIRAKVAAGIRGEADPCPDPGGEGRRARYGMADGFTSSRDQFVAFVS